MRFHYFIFLIFLLMSCRAETEKNNKEVEQETVLILKSPSDTNSSLPRLYSNGKTLFMSWVEKNDSISKLKIAKYNDMKWTHSEEIISGSDWFVNWADFPVIVENNGNLLTSFLQKSANGTYTYDVKLNVYDKKSKNWIKNFILHDDGTKSEHGFVSMVPWKEDQFFVTWLDGRNTVGGYHKNNSMSSVSRGMTLRGAFVNTNAEIMNDIEIDSLVCDCCQTSATKTNDGIIVTYRDRSVDEIRDIAVVRWDMENSWSEPIIIGDDSWKIDGCPVNGPAIDALDNNVAIAWFTAVNDNPTVNISFSNDGGRNFGIPFRVDRGNALGRVDVSMVDSDQAIISWMEPQGEDTLIQIIMVDSKGIMGNPITIAKSSAERASGFPQMEILGDKVYLAWTSLEDNEFTIKLVSVKKENI